MKQQAACLLVNFPQNDAQEVECKLICIARCDRAQLNSTHKLSPDCTTSCVTLHDLLLCLKLPRRLTTLLPNSLQRLHEGMSAADHTGRSCSRPSPLCLALLYSLSCSGANHGHDQPAYMSVKLAGSCKNPLSSSLSVTWPA